jgi:hypothetical protein
MPLALLADGEVGQIERFQKWNKRNSGLRIREDTAGFAFLSGYRQHPSVRCAPNKSHSRPPQRMPVLGLVAAYCSAAAGTEFFVLADDGNEFSSAYRAATLLHHTESGTDTRNVP